MSGVSKSQVSRLCGEIDDKVNGFLDRSVAQGGMCESVQGAVVLGIDRLGGQR